MTGGSPHGQPCISYLPHWELSYFTTSAIIRVEYRIAVSWVWRSRCVSGARGVLWCGAGVLSCSRSSKCQPVLDGSHVLRSCSVVAQTLLEGVLSCALADGGNASLGGTLPKPLPQKPARHRSVGGTNPLRRLGVRDCDSPRCSRADLGLVDTGLRSFVGCDGGFIPSHVPGCTGLPIRGLCWTSKGAFEGTQRVLAFASCCRR